MSAQHKRPGHRARAERKIRAMLRQDTKLRQQKEQEEKIRKIKDAIKVYRAKRYQRFDHISPGRLVAWADGRRASV